MKKAPGRVPFFRSLLYLLQTAQGLQAEGTGPGDEPVVDTRWKMSVHRGRENIAELPVALEIGLILAAGRPRQGID